ncbi:MAG TPA: hypothetical protein PKC76_16210 [Saprospiraceae bacterium]|nr:hypothetical protein [Saprospiraceae bacterium]HMP25676.1 hypothetical protein [Saprospiraceae bacterium]
MERFHTLLDFSETCWRLLVNGAVKRRDPFGTPVIGTYDGTQAQLRTVVLRKADMQQRTLWFYSDWRAAKMAHLQEEFAQLSCLFYHPRKQVQVRLAGQVQLHHKDEIARACWQQVPVRSRKSYAAVLPPGTPTSACTEGLPEGWHPEMDIAATESAFAHFAVIVCYVDWMDCLHLHPEGHQRARFEWSAEGRLQAQWLIP